VLELSGKARVEPLVPPVGVLPPGGVVLLPEPPVGVVVVELDEGLAVEAPLGPPELPLQPRFNPIAARVSQNEVLTRESPSPGPTPSPSSPVNAIFF
jgi:hypothetical protein